MGYATNNNVVELNFNQIFPDEVSGIIFLAAFMGWMPAPLDVSIWQSIWTKEKLNLNNFEILQKDNIHKSKYINDLLRLLALEDILKKLKIKRIFLRVDNINVIKIIKDFSVKNKILLNLIFLVYFQQ